MRVIWSAAALGVVATLVAGKAVHNDLSNTQENQRNILCADYAAVSTFMDIRMFTYFNDGNEHHVQTLNQPAATQKEVVDIAQPSRFDRPMVLNYSLITASGRMRYSVELAVSPSLQITPTSFEFSGTKPNQWIDEAEKQRAIKLATNIAGEFRACERAWSIEMPGIYGSTLGLRTRAFANEKLFVYGLTQ